MLGFRIDGVAVLLDQRVALVPGSAKRAHACTH
jgi:hypothetical protein